MTRAVLRQRRWALWLLGALTLVGCGRYYYTRPDVGNVSFSADSLACIRDVGVPSGNGQYALVAKEPYRRCMLARGWTREQKIEPGYGWYRGVEDDEVIDLTAGPKQPETMPAGSEIFCRARHLDGRSDWRDRLPAYRECLGR